MGRTMLLTARQLRPHWDRSLAPFSTLGRPPVALKTSWGTAPCSSLYKTDKVSSSWALSVPRLSRQAVLSRFSAFWRSGVFSRLCSRTKVSAAKPLRICSRSPSPAAS